MDWAWAVIEQGAPPMGWEGDDDDELRALFPGSAVLVGLTRTPLGRWAGCALVPRAAVFADDVDEIAWAQDRIRTLCARQSAEVT
jgi:hypothetical protein